jgi:fucose permease
MEMWGKLKDKGREVLVLLTAVAILLSAALGLVGDAVLILVVGATGWFLSQDDKPKDEAKK